MTVKINILMKWIFVIIIIIIRQKKNVIFPASVLYKILFIYKLKKICILGLINCYSFDDWNTIYIISTINCSVGLYRICTSDVSSINIL